MAVTTTYALDFLQNTDLPQGPTTSQADATSLANGGFAVIGTHVGHADLDIFAGNLSDDGGANVLTGANSAIDQLANGNLAYVTQDADSILFGIRDSTGAVVLAQADLGDIDSQNADVAALTGGNFVIVNEDDLGVVGGDADIDVRVRDSAGGFVHSFVVNGDVDRDTNASVAALDNGNFVVAWQRDAGANTQIWYAIYNSGGDAVLGPTLTDGFGTINRNVDVSAKNGGFVLVYEDSGWGTGANDITLAEFTSAGTFESFRNISNPTLGNDGSDDANAVVTRLSNGLLVVGYENNVFSDTDSVVGLFDADTNTVLATRTITGGESLFDDVGDITIAGSALGGINVFQTNFTDGDVDGETLVGRRTSTSDGAGDTITGDDFRDVMIGNGGADSLSGGAGNDTLDGGDGADTLDGGDGDDILEGGDGADTLNGGDGNDQFVLNSAAQFAAGETIDGGAGLGDTLLLNTGISGAIFNAASLIGIEKLAFGATGGFGNFVDTHFGTAANRINAVTGSALADRFDITGTAINLTGVAFTAWTNGQDKIFLFGTNGNDTITGSSQDDTIFGSNGVDTWFGGLGNDTFSFGTNDGSAGDVVDGGAGAGDILEVAGIQDLSVVSISGVERLKLNSFVIGPNVTLAGAQFGALGFNEVVGTGSQDDLIVNGAAIDLSGVTFNSWSNGTDVITLNGTAGADSITGSSQADVITGTAGADQLRGGGGNDTLNFDAADSIFGGSGIDTAHFFGTMAGLRNFDLSGRSIENLDWRINSNHYFLSLLSGGARREVVNDISGTEASFSYRETTLDSLLRIELEDRYLDAGGRIVTDFDAANAQAWDQILQIYTTVPSLLLDYTDTRYDNNSRVVRDEDHLANQAWTTITTTYSAPGVVDYQDTVYDSGTRIIFDADQGNAFNWTSVSTTYANGGAVDYQDTNYDDGRRVIFDSDQANGFIWTTQQTSYAPGNLLDVQDTFYDVGQSSARIIFDWDQASAFYWKFFESFYDAAGVLRTQRITRDDDTVIIFNF